MPIPESMLTFLLIRLAWVWHEITRPEPAPPSGLERVRVPVARGNFDRC